MQAHARAVDIFRSDNARAARESAQTLRVSSEPRGTEAMALSLVERAEISDRLDALPACERHPIVLAYFGGHTYREVARLMEVSEGTIKSRIASGLRRLRAEGTLKVQLD